MSDDAVRFDDTPGPLIIEAQSADKPYPPIQLVSVLAEWDKRGVLEVMPSQAPGVHARFPWIPLRAYAASLRAELTRSDAHLSTRVAAHQLP